MPIVAGDIDFHLSGGAGNTLPTASLGGGKSNTQIVDATIGNLFDNVSGAESAAGDTEYRAFYVVNATGGALTLENAKIWIQTPTPSTFTEVNIQLATEAVGTAIAQTVLEDVAPSGITFPTTVPVNEATALSIGNIPSGVNGFKGIWIRRVVTAGAAAFANDGPVLRVQGETQA